MKNAIGIHIMVDLIIYAKKFGWTRVYVRIFLLCVCYLKRCSFYLFIGNNIILTFKYSLIDTIQGKKNPHQSYFLLKSKRNFF